VRPIHSQAVLKSPNLFVSNSCKADVATVGLKLVNYTVIVDFMHINTHVAMYIVTHGTKNLYSCMLKQLIAFVPLNMHISKYYIKTLHFVYITMLHILPHGRPVSNMLA